MTPRSSGLSGEVVRGLVSLAKVQKETDHCVRMGCADSFSSSVFFLVSVGSALPSWHLISVIGRGLDECFMSRSLRAQCPSLVPALRGG